MTLYRFDIPAENYEAIKDFYQGVFGWKFKEIEGTSESWTIQFSSQEQQRVIMGSIVPRSAPNQPIGCHFLVPSIDEASVKVQELGGSVFVPKTATDQGFYACCLDPEGNYFVIWENDKMGENV